MGLNHNQWAVVAITATICLAGMYTIVGSALETLDSAGFEGAGDDIQAPEDETQQEGADYDDDGLSDRMEITQYGTDFDNDDTDGDGLLDGWEVANGLDPLDDGDADFGEIESSQNPNEDDVTTGENNETFPDPDNGPMGDPDRDGLPNAEEAFYGTNPNLRDSDSDGLNDGWEVQHQKMQIGADGIPFLLMNPTDANWDCSLLSPQVEADWIASFGIDEWNLLEDSFTDRHSCDTVLDVDLDTMPNYIEERYGTDPWSMDSDGDLIGDEVEVAFGNINIDSYCGNTVNSMSISAPFTQARQSADNLAWFEEDMDNDGRANGPGDWDTDGDGMPDGFEFCYVEILDPANATDSFADSDGDGLSNVEEYQVAYTWGPSQFTDPTDADSDDDFMPDGWEANNGLNPRNGSNGIDDPDHDGFDQNGNGDVTLSDFDGFARVHAISVEPYQEVIANQTVAWAKVTLSGASSGGSQYELIPLSAPCAGFVYSISAQINDEITERSFVWMNIVEHDERFTNLDEYEARDRDGDGVIDGRSSDPLNPDTDGDGLLDGIEVMGWTIRVVNRGVNEVHVTSDPGVFDTDGDGLNDSREYYITYTNASNRDTDSDNLEDYTEAVDGFVWDGVPYTTNASMFDTDNDGLEDGEEIALGLDQYITHANNSDTDNDTLNDGDEVLFIPRPWQSATNPLVNDTDNDGMLDGWEMQVESTTENTRSHSLWISMSPWRPIGCEDSSCEKSAGGWIYLNGIQEWSGSAGDADNDGKADPKYFVHEMNLTGFSMPSEGGRWALDPAMGSLPDASFDVDNDTLPNAMEAPDRWNTNPVDDDTDGDRLADGWEVYWSDKALELGLSNSEELQSLGARGPMDPSMIDSDLDGIEDGEEDFDQDGLNRTNLLNRYCPSHNDPTTFNCHIDPTTDEGAQFYNDLENFTNYEELLNGTSPVQNDTEGDGLEDGPEVFYQDHDNDDMASGWEYYFQFDPFDAADALIDVDQDGYTNKCEEKWYTNPREPTSFPGQGQHCDNFE